MFFDVHQLDNYCATSMVFHALDRKRNSNEKPRKCTLLDKLIVVPGFAMVCKAVACVQSCSIYVKYALVKCSQQGNNTLGVIIFYDPSSVSEFSYVPYVLQRFLLKLSV